MEKTTGTRTGRKPKNDPADHKYSFRLNAEENTRFEKLLADSGAGNLTLFIKKSIFSGQIKVVKIDKATMDYYRIPQTVPGCRQQLQPGRPCLEEQFRGETGDGIAL